MGNTVEIEGTNRRMCGNTEETLLGTDDKHVREVRGQSKNGCAFQKQGTS